MTQPTPQVIAMAAGLGVDLVNGDHDAVTAEAARRAGVELLHFPQWNWETLTAFGDAMKAIAAEEARDVARFERVMEAMRQHGVATVGGVPRAELCRIFECGDADLAAVIDTAFAARWWHQHR